MTPLGEQHGIAQKEEEKREGKGSGNDRIGPPGSVDDQQCGKPTLSHHLQGSRRLIVHGARHVRRCQITSKHS
ncbi:hypothetical protein [Streptomyces sp. M3]|uniref:hypothetical protein n=1 Tax=Streptomyces sp. M3 TaxID=295102 RepID=UPI00100DC070|nr:hypothetical protein [Streptomyces sp. M3]